MATERQLKANRATERLSSGPTSDKGKAASSRNALRHGLTSRTIYLQGEDPNHCLELRNRMWSKLRPRDVIEEELVERIVSLSWRLRRIPAFEAALFMWISGGFNQQGDDATSPEVYNAETPLVDMQYLWGRMIEAVMSKDYLSKLSRYEAQLSNQLQKTMAQLEKRQAERFKNEAETLQLSAQ